jgi:hypothetical protein
MDRVVEQHVVAFPLAGVAGQGATPTVRGVKLIEGQPCPHYKCRQLE